MSENKLNEIIKSSLEGVKNFTDMQTVVGNTIVTPNGVTIIPISKLTVGFLSGGVDLGAKKLVSSESFGSGSASGVSITPIAFLTIGKNAEINLVKNSRDDSSPLEKISSLIDNSPEILKKIKDVFS